MLLKGAVLQFENVPKKILKKWICFRFKWHWPQNRPIDFAIKTFMLRYITKKVDDRIFRLYLFGSVIQFVSSIFHKSSRFYGPWLKIIKISTSGEKRINAGNVLEIYPEGAIKSYHKNFWPKREWILVSDISRYTNKLP